MTRPGLRLAWSPPGGRVVDSSLSVRILGGGGPPVVLLHGLVGSGMYWGSAYDRLAEDHRLVVPDLLGFGRSPWPPSGYGPDEHADALRRCLDDLGISASVVIAAHSLGGLVALRLARTQPHRVAGIVAFGPPLYPDRATARARVAATSRMGSLFVLPGPAAEMACRWMCSHRAVAARLAVVAHPALPPAIAADAVQHTWASYSQTLERVILAADASGWLDRITCPVRLVAGDRDPVVDRRHLRHLARRHAGVELAEWPGGHNLPLARPEDCIEEIEHMARRVVPTLRTATTGTQRGSQAYRRGQGAA